MPSAKLWIGPYQFFFENRKFIGKDHVWFDQNFDEETWNRFPKAAKEFENQSKGIRRAIRKLTYHSLRPQLESALLLINEGMISDDLAFRLMRFWSAAEALYAPEEEKTSSKLLISRLTFASKADDWLDKIKLERCYHLRNQYVHRGSNGDDDTSLVQHLRELILHQVYYYLWQGQDILAQKDLLMMVDTRLNEAEIERRTLAIQRRLNIERTGKHHHNL